MGDKDKAVELDNVGSRIPFLFGFFLGGGVMLLCRNVVCRWVGVAVWRGWVVPGL